jgi:hypothetical protein
MANMRIIVPRCGNLLTRVSASQITLSTGTANSLFPLSYLYDGIPSRAFAAAAAGNLTVDIDGDILQNYGLVEGTFAAGVAPGFTNGSTGTGTLAEEGTIVHLGGSTKSQKVSTGAGPGVGRAHRDILVRAGEVLTPDFWLRTDGTATICVRLQDQQTGKWWDGAAWQASVSNWTTHNTTTWTEKTPTAATLDSAVNWRAGLGWVRLSFVVDSATALGSGYFDDCVLWPSCDFCGVFGHNIPLGATVDFRSSTSSGWGSPTTEATLAVYQPSFYSILAAPVARRFWRVRITDAIALAALYMGQLVIGSTVTLTASPDYPVSVRRRTDHNRAVTRFGHPHVSAITQTPAREADLAFTLLPIAQFRELRDQIYLACNGDLNSLVAIPRDDDPEHCFFGRIDGALEHQLVMADNWTSRLHLVEHPFPVVA